MPTFFPTPADFRRWLEAEGQKTPELMVGFYKRSAGTPSITYAEALDQALCFGWIDGVRRSLSAHAYTVRFTPRKPKSQWSAVNIRHAERLIKAGRMCSEGMKAFAASAGQPRKYSYEQRQQARLSPAQERRLRSNRKAWEFFQAQPPWYRRTATFWVVSAKKDATRERRFEILFNDCAHQRSIKPLQRPSGERPSRASDPRTSVPKRKVKSK